MASGSVHDAARSHVGVQHDFDIKRVARVNWATKPVVWTASGRMVEDGRQALFRAAQPKPEGFQFARKPCRQQGLGGSLACP